MKTRRIMALLLVLVMVVGTMLVGCGKEESKQSSQQTSSAQESKSDESSSTEEVEELEPYTVTWWMRGEESKDHKKVMELVNAKIQETLPNTTLEIVFAADSEYNDRWTKALAAGEKIDIGWSASWVNSPIGDVAQGVLLDVEDLLKEYGQGIVEAVGGWDVLDMNRIEGGIYHILAWQGLVGGRYALYIPKRVADVLPEGWLEESEKIFTAHEDFTVEDKMAMMDRIEELVEIARANGVFEEGLSQNCMSNLLENKAGGNGLVFNNYNVCVVEENGVFTVMPWYHNEVYKAYADRLNEWYKKGYYREDILSASSKNTEKHIFAIATAVSDDYIEKQILKKGYDLAGCLMQENNLLIQGFDTGVVFPYTGENPERSMQVLNLVYTDAELYRLLVYGVEGEHYVNNADGTITRPASGNRTYEGITNWTLGTCINSLAENADNIGYYERLVEEQKTAGSNPLVGFAFSAVNNGVSTESANIVAVRNEYERSFFTTNYEERYKEFEDKMNKAGMETYMAAFKKALTEYVEANGLGTVAP